MTGSVQLIDETEPIGMARRPDGFDESLEDIFHLGGLDVEALPETMIPGQLFADAKYQFPVELLFTPVQRRRRAGSDFLDDPCTCKLG